VFSSLALTYNHKSPHLWAELSTIPDLNTVNHRIGRVMQKRVYQKPVNDEDQLIEELDIEELTCRQKYSRVLLINRFYQRRECLSACAKTKIKHFKHLNDVHDISDHCQRLSSKPFAGNLVKIY